jgi:glycosyltransferase involved in cell wall biosynthesis
MRLPVFSIITVTYNAEKVLERTLKSVMEQVYPDIEHIIIDGSSTDGTVNLVKDYAKKNKKIRWMSEPDQGLYDAMNKGLRAAAGDYVWFLNAGDVLHDTTVVEKLSSCNPDIFYGETDIVDDKGNFMAHRRLKAPEKLTWKSFKMGMLVSHQSFIVKREIAPFYDLKYRFSSDFDWCIRCLKVSNDRYNTHLVLSDYLNEGMTTANRKASLKERFSIMSYYYGYIPTAIRHFWFAARFYISKISGKQL